METAVPAENQIAETISAKVHASFATQGLMRTLDARISAVDAGRCTISAPIGPATSQQTDLAHAGVAFALGDSAGGYAALTLMAAEDEVVTVEMKIHLLAPAKGDRLVAEGRVVRAGRRVSVVASDVFAIDGEARTHVATLLGSMMPVRPSRPSDPER
jgi:uncharacterized protein (TIGR00369 family)